MTKRRILFLVIVLAEAGAIAGLGASFTNRDPSRFAAAIVPLYKNAFIEAGDGALPHFYEPAPGDSAGEGGIGPNPDWLPRKPLYTINADALNDRFDYPAQKPPQTYRIVTIGDSFTYGLFVDTAKNYSERLEDILNDRASCSSSGTRYEVLNLGVPGYGMEYAAERFVRRGVKYDPDLVIWFIKADDMWQLDELVRSEDARYIADREREGEIIDPEDASRRTWAQVFKSMGAPRFFEYHRASFEKVAEHHDGDLLLMSLPPETFGDITANYNVPLFLIHRQEAFLSSLASGRDRTSFYNGLPNIYKLGAAFPDGHPDEAGHDLIANDLLRYLIQNGTISCVKS